MKYLIFLLTSEYVHGQGSESLESELSGGNWHASPFSWEPWFSARNPHGCEMTNWHQVMDRSNRCRVTDSRRICDCEEFYLWPIGTYGRRVKISFPSHFDLWTDDGFPVVFQYHGTNMDPITSKLFKNTFERDEISLFQHFRKLKKEK